MHQKKYNPSKKEFMKTIVSENLKKFRDSSDYSQLDVAQFLGIERGAYANYESGSREMPYVLVLKICELYGISVSSLFEEDFSKIENEIFCAFRLKNPNNKDIAEMSQFKNVVRNYLKMCSY
jgi:transcriptional regulator with XRE-family HTH domain